MDSKLNLKVGQEVAIKVEEMSSIARRTDMSIENIDNWCFAGTVTKVTKKYITVKFNIIEKQFTIEDDYREKYTRGLADYKLYESKQDVIDEYESKRLHSMIRSKFSSFDDLDLTLVQLKRIQAIIEEC